MEDSQRVSFGSIDMEAPQKIEQMLTGLEDMPPIQLHELVDQLDCGEQDQFSGFGPPPPTEEGVLAAESFWDVLQKAKLTGLCDLLTYAGVREELPQLLKEKVTVLAPTNTALAQLSEATRKDSRLLRQIVFAHICSGRSSLEEMQRKNCAVAMAGQTHAVYTEGGQNNVGTARLGRTDFEFSGGIVHEVHSVLLVVQLLSDCHVEQVWKKTLQPSPQISVCGGGVHQGVGVRVELEVHACLLHVATGQLVPEALVGHLKPLEASSLGDEKQLAFNELTVITKPPSLSKRPGRAPPEGANRYRLLFSIWNSSTLSYVTWQHMQTCLVVRNSFHMLPLEEKNWRRQQYSRGRDVRPVAADTASAQIISSLNGLPSLPEGEPSAPLLMPPRSGEPFSGFSGEKWVPLAACGLPQPPSLEAARCRNETFTSTSISSSSPGDEEWSSLNGSLDARLGVQGGVGEDVLAELALEPEEELSQLQAMAQAMDGLGGGGASSSTQFVFKGSSLTSGLSPSSSAAPPAALPSGAAGTSTGTSISTSHVMDGPPVLLDCSVHEGSCRGGTAMWLHGKRLRPEMTVTFGGVPCRQVAVVSGEVIKLVTPPCMPHNAHHRHQVFLGLVDRSSGLQCSSSTLVFDFVPDAPAAAPVRPALLQELLQRLLGSLEHAQAAAAAATADDEPAAAAAAAAAVRALLQRADEHGYSLEGYAGGLHKMLDSLGWLADRQAGASELQAQHQELAALVTRERLSGALANRPTPERLHERNILPTPDAEQQAVARRKSLSNSLLNRPAPDSLQERNILHDPEAERQAVARRERLSGALANRPAPDRLQERNILQSPEADQQLAMKRKRLEGFLAERPPPESVEQVLWGPAFNVGVPPQPPQGGLPVGSRSTPGSRSPHKSMSPRSPRRSPVLSPAVVPERPGLP